jgi:hypothetical protein
MTSYYVFSALAAQREDEIERQALLAQRRRACVQAAARSPEPPRRRRLGWHRRRHLRLV